MANTKISELNPTTGLPSGFFIPVIQSTGDTNTSYKISSDDLKIACQGEKGDPGIQGVPGADGLGVPAGGTAGQGLYKINSTDNNTERANPDYCIATNAGAQSIPNGVYTNIVLDAYDTNNSAMTVTANKIQARKTGLYLLTCNLLWASNATGVRTVFLTKNSTSMEALGFTDNTGGFALGYFSSNHFSGLIQLTIGDEVFIRCFQSSGVALNLTGANLSVTKIQ